jgi:preprotein translocase subunit YajC
MINKIRLSFLTMTLSLSAFAQAQPAAKGAQPFMASSFVPIILMFLVFYFFMIRPQKKKHDEEQGFLKALKKGDEVYTKSGILGKVCGLTEKVVTLEIAEAVKVKVLRSTVGGLSKQVFETAKS